MLVQVLISNDRWRQINRDLLKRFIKIKAIVDSVYRLFNTLAVAIQFIFCNDLFPRSFSFLVGLKLPKHMGFSGSNSACNPARTLFPLGIGRTCPPHSTKF